ncbi:MAG TPA: GFA family protein [Solirubrobacteraceae bacterium]|nr:GFA family protein [Solirubrobacteraceae bacterium]
MTTPTRTGSCLCGAVQYRVRGPLRDVIICHCDDCRRWHGHVCAMAAARRDDVSIEGEDTLRWFTIPGPGSAPARARRGFCAQCGSSLFWDAPERDTVSIAAGTMDPPTGLRTIAHIYTDLAGDYEPAGSDGLPRYPRAAPASALRIPDTIVP